MPDSNKLQEIYEFVKGQKLAIIATVNTHALPEAAVVGFWTNERLEIYFATFASSRKHKNIQTNPKVAAVIGWEAGKTVQLEGTVGELEEKEINEFKANLLGKIPTAAKFVEAEEERFFKIKPSWVRYSDLSKDPWYTFELTFI